MKVRSCCAWPALVLLMALMLAIGCAAPAPAPAEANESPPLSLPAGEAGVLRIAEGGPPLRRPSLNAEGVNQPQKLELPSIRVETDIVPIGWYVVQQPNGTQVSEWEVADSAAGWHKNSALPGQGGNVVLSGHNNIAGAVFRKLYTMKPGDDAYVWAGGQRIAYRVEEVMILEEKGASLDQRRDNAKWIQPYDDDRLTLVSCWPETDNTHRVIVVAKRVEE
ncbi:MAG: sortase [Caldilineaceae bacterium]|nr:sortase [Caldilineaceae bacterium]